MFGAPTVSACAEGESRVGGGAEGGEEGAQAREGFAEGDEEEGEHGLGDLEEVVAGQPGKQAVDEFGRFMSFIFSFFGVGFEGEGKGRKGRKGAVTYGFQSQFQMPVS